MAYTIVDCIFTRTCGKCLSNSVEYKFFCLQRPQIRKMFHTCIQHFERTIFSQSSTNTGEDIFVFLLRKSHIVQSSYHYVWAISVPMVKHATRNLGCQVRLQLRFTKQRRFNVAYRHDKYGSSKDLAYMNRLVVWEQRTNSSSITFQEVLTKTQVRCKLSDRPLS